MNMEYIHFTDIGANGATHFIKVGANGATHLIDIKGVVTQKTEDYSKFQIWDWFHSIFSILFRFSLFFSVFFFFFFFFFLILF